MPLLLTEMPKSGNDINNNKHIWHTTTATASTLLGIISLTLAAKLALHAIRALSRPERRDQRRQVHQIGDTKMGPPGGNHDERVFRFDARPVRWQPQQIPVGVTIHNPVFAPSLLTTDEVDFPPREWMERMRNPDRTGH